MFPSIEFVHHDVEIIGAHAGAEHGDAFAVEIARAGDEFAVLAFHLDLVEERGNHDDTTRVANQYDIVGQLVGMKVQVIYRTLVVEDQLRCGNGLIHIFFILRLQRYEII